MIAGTLAAFADAHLFVVAARRLRALRCERVQAYMPYALPELDGVLGIRRTNLRWWVLAAGLAGVVFAYLVQWWCNAFDYPYLVGGRPYDSIPTDVPIMFETAVLFAGTTAFLGMLLLSRMPRLWSPVLDAPGFDRTSVDRFWLVVPVSDPGWTADLAGMLAELGAVEVRDLGATP
jgi:hypothetical protein